MTAKTADIVERLGAIALCEKLFADQNHTLVEAANEIERLRKVNVMQARWLHEAQQEHKKFKDYVRQLLNVESAALKEGE
jgi:hypothetical protein